MRWSKKGREYDDVYRQMERKRKFFLFGAGDYGYQFITIFRESIDIIGYIDNDEKKQGKIINGIPCISLEQYSKRNTEGIIVTMSQIARVSTLKQLEDNGYERNVDFFIIEEFISIYYVYKFNKVYFSSVSFLPSTICNLNCRNCLNFNPFAKQFYSREWNELVEDVDLFFKHIDHIMLFHISGGEPFLYKNTAKLIEYIDKHYSNQIDTLRTVTNGTVVPSDEMLKTLAMCNVEVTVDDYREALPRFEDNFNILINKLEENKIKYYINKADAWIDLAPERTDYSNKSEEWLMGHRSGCSQSWQELRNGKLYSCNYAAYATVAGIAGLQDIEETYDLTTHDKSKNKELIEFRLGYTNKGYTEFCKKCRGFCSDNNINIEPAKQQEEKIRC